MECDQRNYIIDWEHINFIGFTRKWYASKARKLHRKSFCIPFFKIELRNAYNLYFPLVIVDLLMEYTITLNFVSLIPFQFNYELSIEHCIQLVPFQLTISPYLCMCHKIGHCRILDKNRGHINKAKMIFLLQQQGILCHKSRITCCVTCMEYYGYKQIT
jgi:hypothetical protein